MALTIFTVLFIALLNSVQLYGLFRFTHGFIPSQPRKEQTVTRNKAVLKQLRELLTI
jgi:hypothetical protein